MDDMFSRRRAPITGNGQGLNLAPKQPATPVDTQPAMVRPQPAAMTYTPEQREYTEEQAPTEAPQQEMPIQTNGVQKRGGAKKVFSTIFFVLLIAGAGALGYFYKTTNDSLKSKSQKLSSAYKTIETFQAIIDQNQTEKDFVAKYNTPALSVSQCSGKPMSMFDVHATSSYVVYRFLCANSSNPIRIGAFQKQTDGSYKFSYGASSAKPNDLPGYIYDTDAAFFHLTYGSNRI